MTVFDAKNYKDFLSQVLSTSGEARGMRSKLANHLNCQNGFITQVLGGETHFSLEHAMKINHFLGNSHEESHFFMLLVQRDRSGSIDLQQYYQEQLNSILKDRQEIKKRLKDTNTISVEDASIYYSHWYYSAIHVLTSIPVYQDKKRVAERLGLELELVSEVLEFLIQLGLVELKHGKYINTGKRLHLPKNSPLISKHHTNWRVEAIKSLEQKEKLNLHYSLVLSISEKDAQRLRDLLLEMIDQSEKIFIPSPEEEMYVLNLDWFLA